MAPARKRRSTQARILALVDNSAPNPDRPRLSNAREKKLAPIDRARARIYARCEAITEQLDRLAEEVGERLDRGWSSEDDGQNKAV